MDEPTPAAEDLVEFGDERILAIDYTEGGAPIGLTEREFREIEARIAGSAGWSVARSVLREVAHASGVPDARDAVGYVQFLGRGLSHNVYGASTLLSDREAWLVVKLPGRDPPVDRDESVRREARLLRWLLQRELPFRVPRAIAEVLTTHGLVAVQEWISGLPVDLRAHRFPGGRPWEFVGRVAAAVHALNADPMRAFLPSHATRRDHVANHARVLDAIEESEGEEARAWVRENCPPTEPARLLHGDLFGQNLQLSIGDDLPAIVDWADALLGDPAYDLAIVTRGVRRPFGNKDGLQRLIDAYNGHSSRPLTVTNVHVHELILSGKWYVESVTNYGRGSPHAENQRRALRAILTRAVRTHD